MRNKLFIAITLLFFFSNTNAQEEDNKDFALWNSVGIKYAPIKRLKLGVEQHIRLKEDASETDEYFTEVFAGFEIVKNLEIGGAMRFIRENDNVGKIQGYEKHFRYNIDLGYKLDLVKRLDISFRLRYQNKKELDLEDGVEDVPTETLRFKTGFEYNIRKWPLDPSFAIEIFDRKDVESSLFEDSKLSRYRLTFGTSYNLKKFGKIGIYYRYQENTRVDNDFQTKILGLKYSYTIKGKSKPKSI
jgi:opacity protein-like surface antigen